MSHVSRGFLSAQVVQQRFQLRHDEGEVWSTSVVLCHPRQQSKLKSLGSPAMVVERPVRFKVVSEVCVQRWMWRAPHALSCGLDRPNPTWERSCLGVPGSDTVFRYLGCMVLQQYFDEGSCMTVALSVWCGGLLCRLVSMYDRSWEIGDRVCVM